MAFDAIVTRAMVKELNDLILLGKIDKIYQPIRDELVINIHTKRGNKGFSHLHPATRQDFILSTIILQIRQHLFPFACFSASTCPVEE